MKPLPTAPWTQEDTDIWVRVLERHGLYWYALCLEWFQGQDRRDAELMLYAQQYPLITWVGPPMIHVRNSVAAYWADPEVPA